MDRRRAPPLRDPLCRFYSTGAVGRVVAEAVADPSPRRVVDLGSGSGVLAAAASSRWPGVHVATLDVDPSAAEASRRNGHSHLHADVLDPAISALAELADADVVLSNPPFGIARPLPHHVELLAAAGLPTHAPGNLELLFAARALLSARDGGSVVLVMSDGFATGRRNADARRAILASHRVASVTQMPSGSFLGTEAGGFVLALVKGGAPADGVSLREARADGTVHAAIRVPRADAAERFDRGFHAAMRMAARGPTLRELGASVVRGSCETGGAVVGRELVFHTTDFPRVGPRSIELPLSQAARPPARVVLAEPGDVLVARLGRGLERKVCLIVGGWTAPSSAVLRIRLPGGAGAKVAEALLSPGGAARLAATARGTCARMLGREDLLAMPLPL